MIDFVQVEEKVKSLTGQADIGEIDPDTLETRLMDLVDVSDDGYYWMYGHQTGQWYRHDGAAWIVDTPPADKIPLRVNWDSIDPGWFFLSVVALTVVGGIIYSSAV